MAVALFLYAAISIGGSLGQSPTRARDFQPPIFSQGTQAELNTQASPLLVATGGEALRGGLPPETSVRAPVIGIQRFADAEPGVGAAEASEQPQTCRIKLCPRPQR